MPDISKENIEEISSKFTRLVTYLTGPSVFNDILLTFGKNIDKESYEYKVFLKMLLASTTNFYQTQNNQNLLSSDNSQKPLVKPSNAIKNIMMSEMLNIK